MDRSKLDLWISERYTRRRDFVRKSGRSKPWVFRCGYCAERQIAANDISGIPLFHKAFHDLMWN